MLVSEFIRALKYYASFTLKPKAGAGYTVADLITSANHP